MSNIAAQGGEVRPSSQEMGALVLKTTDKTLL